MHAIKLSEDLRPMTALKSQGAEIVRHVTETGRPVVLTKHGRGIAVVLSLEEYEQLMERVNSAELQRAVEEAEASFAEARVVRHTQMRTKLERWASGEEG